jgi:hypothetical protein
LVDVIVATDEHAANNTVANANATIFKFIPDFPLISDGCPFCADRQALPTPGTVCGATKSA